MKNLPEILIGLSAIIVGILMIYGGIVYMTQPKEPHEIYIDWQHGKDTNDGLTPQTALKTFKATSNKKGYIIYEID